MPVSKSLIIEKRLAALERRFKDMRQLNSLGVLVGYPAASSDNDREGSREPTNAELAYLHTYGTQNIPARPFLEPALEQNATRLAAALEPDISDPTSTKPLELAGLLAETEVKNYLQTSVTPPLAPSTIKARQRAHKTKGSNFRPLIDTGQLRNAVKYVIDKTPRIKGK